MRNLIRAALFGLALLALSAGSFDATGNLEVAMESFTVTCPEGPVNTEVISSQVPPGWTSIVGYDIPFYRVQTVTQLEEGRWFICCKYRFQPGWYEDAALTTRVTATSCTKPPEIPGTGGATGRDVTCYRPAKLKAIPKPK